VKPLGWDATGLFVVACFLFFFTPSLQDDEEVYKNMNLDSEGMEMIYA